MSDSCFRAVADRLTEPVLLLSPTGEIVSCNRAATLALGSDLAGSSLVERAANQKGLRRYLALASRSSSSLPGSVRFDGADAEWRCDAGATWLDGQPLLILQLRSNTESVRRFVALNQQIDRLQAEIRCRTLLEQERQHLFERERAARAAAEEAGRFKDELLASISHELRTPLHAIQGWITMIRDDPTDHARLMRGLEVIERNVAVESQLTEDLVDTSLVITGRMKLSIRPVDLEQVVRQAVDSIRPAADAKNQRLELIADIGNCIVNGDPDRLLQIMWNLLSNAAKYTPKGGKIQVILRRVNSHVEIVVSDTGEGLPGDVLPYVFDRFRRGDGTMTRRHGGLGLGLAIVRHLVELHGGVVLADSEGRDQGARFTVNLPLPVFRQRMAATPDYSADEPAAPAGALSGIEVLLIEDHDDSREILGTILGARGASVKGVAGSADAQAAFRDRPFDVVVSDIEMPDEDGFTLMRKLRELERELGRNPVAAIAVSAHSIGDARLHALRAGYQAFLPKPMNPAELVALVQSFCLRQKMP